MIVSLEGKDVELSCNFNPPIQGKKLGLISFFCILENTPPNGHKPIKSVTIISNITRGVYNNGEKSHFIYKFPVTISPTYIVRYDPPNVIYLPVLEETISNISLRFLDQDGDEIKRSISKTVLLDLE